MQRAYTSILDDETISMLNTLARSKFGKDRKTSNFLRDLIAMLYSGCVIVTESGNVHTLSKGSSQPERVVRQEQEVSKLFIGVTLDGEIELANLTAKYKEKG